jgi:hypothetical protein
MLWKLWSLVLLAVAALPATAQQFKRTDYFGTWVSYSETDTRTYGDDTLPVFTRHLCYGQYELTGLDRKVLTPMVHGDPDSVFPYARQGGKARLVAGTEVCSDSTLRPDGVSGSPKPDTSSIIGILSYDDYVPSRRAGLDIVLDITSLDSFVTNPRFRRELDGFVSRDIPVTRRRFSQQPGGSLRGEGICESLGGLVRANRGFGPRQECTFITGLAVPATPSPPPSDRAAATAAGDSIAALSTQFWETVDTLLWSTAKPQAIVIRSYLTAASFPRSYAELEVQTLLRNLASFADGDQSTREMVQGPYRLSPESQRRRVDAAKATRARLSNLASSSKN